MPGFHIRSADGAPTLGLAEYFGRLPESALRDHDISDEAKVLLAGIYLNIAKEHTSPVSVATNDQLAQLVGCTARSVRRRLADLETRGHVERERVRTIPGSPRCIRPLAKLRGVGQLFERTPTSGCRRTPASSQPDTIVLPGGQQCPIERTATSAPLLLKGEEKKDPQERPADGDEPDGTGTPPPVAGEDALTTAQREDPHDLAGLDELAARGGAPGRWAATQAARIRKELEAQGKSPGSSAKIPPGSHARDSAPVENIVPDNQVKSQDLNPRMEHKLHS